MLMGCGHIDSSENNKDLTGYKIDYMISSKDGQNIYQVNGQDYPFLIRLTGRSENAKYDSYYVVFWGSYMTSTEDFVIVEYGLIDE